MKKIAEGELQRRGIRVVFLPYHQAMSRSQAAGLRRFVEQGGILIADLRPAVMDEHGEALERGLLDDVFGIRRDGPAASQAVRARPRGAGVIEGLAESGMELTADASVSLDGGKSLGTVADAPIYVEHEVGKGRAILLNFSLDDYLTARETERHRALQQLFAKLLEGAGVSPVTRVTASGKPLDGLWLTQWKVGPTLVAGVDRRPVSPARDKPLKARVHWPEPGEIYDVRAGKHLGRQGETDINLAVREPQLLAWLPYRIGKLSVAGPETARPGEGVQVEIALQDVKGPHVVCLDVFGPDGKRRVYFRRRLFLKDGRGQAAFPLALNAAAGDWRIRAREVIGGQVVWHNFRIAAP